MKSIGRYDYEDLKNNFLALRTDEALNELAKWYELYGMQFWNGECYSDDYVGRIYPIYKEIDEDESEIIGYEVRS